MLALISSAAVDTILALSEVCSAPEDIWCEMALSSVEELDRVSTPAAISRIMRPSPPTMLFKALAKTPILVFLINVNGLPEIAFRHFSCNGGSFLNGARDGNAQKKAKPERRR